MTDKGYKPLPPIEARRILNELGYDVQGMDSYEFAINGIIVAMAREIEKLRELAHVPDKQQ